MIRRRRVDTDGNWEYECSKCKLWLPKVKFKGCVEKVDAYGNCLMCRSCISSRAKQKVISQERKEVEEILIALGYDINGIPIHEQFEKRIKDKYGGL